MLGLWWLWLPAGVVLIVYAIVSAAELASRGGPFIIACLLLIWASREPVPIIFAVTGSDLWARVQGAGAAPAVLAGNVEGPLDHRRRLDQSCFVLTVHAIRPVDPETNLITRPAWMRDQFIGPTSEPQGGVMTDEAKLIRHV